MPSCRTTDDAILLTKGDQRVAAECSSGRTASRWADGNASYHLIAAAGRTESDWVGSVWGIAAGPEGGPVVFDAQEGQLKVLDRALHTRRLIGRSGSGPGELATLSMPTYGNIASTWLGASATSIWVYDSRKLTRFTTRGEYQYAINDVPPLRLFPLSVLGIAVVGDAVLVGVDLTLARSAKSPTLQTWLVNRDTAYVIFETPLPDPPKRNGYLYRGELQASPLWAANERCVVHSDGAGRWIQLYSLALERRDSIGLPDIGPSAEEYDQVRQRLVPKPLVERMTGQVTPLPEPTTLARWTGLALDPDGAIWLRVWEANPARNGNQRVLTVSASSGRVRQFSVGAFPRAFTEPGEFYGTVFDRSTEEELIVRYVRSP